MGVGVSIFLIAIGAVLFWAVEATVQGINLDAVGVILMIVGGAGLLLSLYFWESMPWRGARRVVEREYVDHPDEAHRR